MAYNDPGLDWYAKEEHISEEELHDRKFLSWDDLVPFFIAILVVVVIIGIFCKVCVVYQRRRRRGHGPSRSRGASLVPQTTLAYPSIPSYDQCRGSSSSSSSSSPSDQEVAMVTKAAAAEKGGVFSEGGVFAVQRCSPSSTSSKEMSYDHACVPAFLPPPAAFSSDPSSDYLPDKGSGSKSSSTSSSPSMPNQQMRSMFSTVLPAVQSPGTDVLSMPPLVMEAEGSQYSLEVSRPIESISEFADDEFEPRVSAMGSVFDESVYSLEQPPAPDDFDDREDEDRVV